MLFQHRRLPMKLIKRYLFVFLIFFALYLIISYKNRLFPHFVFGEFHLISSDLNQTINLRQSQLFQHELPDGATITLYDVKQDNEWKFQCPKTKYRENDINDVFVCIYDPQHDEHVSGQLNDHGKWEPVVVRSFLRLLRSLPNTREMKNVSSSELFLFSFRCDRCRCKSRFVHIIIDSI